MKTLKDVLAILGGLATILSLGFVILSYTNPPRASEIAQTFNRESEINPTQAPTALPIEVTRIVPVTVEVVREITVPVESTRIALATVVVEVTREIVVTPTPIPPTPEPPTTPTPEFTTPGSILAFLETWRGDGVDLTLTTAELCVDCSEYYGQIRLDWVLENKTSQDLIASYDKDSFAARDNLGNELQIIGWAGKVIPLGPQNCKDATFTLPRRKSIALSTPCTSKNADDPYRLGVIADLADKDLTEVIVTVKGVSRINGAEWRVTTPR